MINSNAIVNILRLCDVNFSGPSIRSRMDKWDIAMEQGVIEKDMLEKFNTGQKIPYKTAYGKGFFCKEHFDSDRKIKIHMEKPIPVSLFIIKVVTKNANCK